MQYSAQAKEPTVPNGRRVCAVATRLSRDPAQPRPGPIQGTMKVRRVVRQVELVSIVATTTAMQFHT